jgi:hypothetical protein
MESRLLGYMHSPLSLFRDSTTMDIDLQRLYALLSAVFLVLGLACVLYLIGHEKPGRASSLTLGAFILSALSSTATVIVAVISLTRISDAERPPVPLTQGFSNGLDFLDNAMRVGLAVTFLALLIGVALLGWRHSRTLGFVSAVASAIVVVLAIAALVLTA